MKLIPNWRDVLRRAWSIRFMLLSFIFSFAEVAFPIWGAGKVPPGLFAGLAGFFSAAAFVSRTIAQKGITRAD